MGATTTARVIAAEKDAIVSAANIIALPMNLVGTIKITVLITLYEKRRSRSAR